jgi:cyclic beta-1,2-glucan glucanotransferase
MGERQLNTAPCDVSCPALDVTLCWDDLEHLRGELLTQEPLSAHAIELAKAHGEPALDGGRSPLWGRIAVSRARLRQAYAILARRSRDSRELSPAEQRLLDDASSIQSQGEELRRALPRGYLRQLPRLSHGAMRGFPRVYALCLDYLRHTDGHLQSDTLVGFLESYQSVRRLTSAELWAVPPLLRLGLVMRVGALAASEASERSREEAHGWAERVRASAAQPAHAAAVLRDLDRSAAARSPAFLVRLSKRLREHDGSLELTREWIAARCFAMGTTPEELTRREHLSQAADQVSIGNAVSSLRELGALSWEKFFERTSSVEPILAADPSGAYRLCDQSTRDRYRRAVQDLAQRSRKDEAEVARAAIAASRRQLDAPASQRGPASERAPAFESSLARGHIGYFLIDDGRAELEHRIGYQPTLGMMLTRALASQPAAFYFSAFAVLMLVMLGLVAEVLEGAAVVPLGRILLLLLTCLPASEIALAVVNAVSLTLLPPRRLAKLDFRAGIPEEQRTLVVVSALLDSPDAIDRLMDELRVRSLANPDPRMHFALLTDFTDAPTAVVQGDSALVERAREGIIALNAQAGASPERFWLLHRRRVRSQSEGCFMGWERKRGKLEELNRLLRGDVSTTFSSVLAPRARFAAIRNVITLDVDTVLPRDVAAELVGAIAHPLNRPEVDPALRRVVRGHGIIQPRVGSLAQRERRTRFAAAWSNPSGVDPYTSALSDTYQDVFCEGSFVGKGIYDVDAFQASLDGRVPEARMLSHYLFEGIYARSALATDIEIFDEPPSSHVQQMERVHRWMRGDWQLLPWLLPKVPTEDGLRQNDLRFIDCWKILDNLRRALLAPSLVALVVAGWFAPPRVAAAAAAILLGVFIVPLLARSLLGLRRGAPSPARPSVGSLGGDLRTSSTQALLNLIFALDLAWVSADACLRSLYRLLLSKRQLLDGRAAGSLPVLESVSVPVRLWLSGALSLLGLAMVVASAPDTWAFAMPLLLAWTGAPLLAAWLSLPIEPMRVAPFSDADRGLLLELAQKTWRFFDELVTEADNHLPPESFQQEPRSTTVRRTSPTNVGAYLLSVVSARDLGFITSRETRERLGRTLTSMEKLEKHAGHLLRSYETTSLRPVEPRYVSTVESGNLCAFLWTLRQACLDLADEPFLSGRTLEAVCDALRLAQGPKGVRAVERRARALLESSPRQLVRVATDLRGELAELRTQPDELAANRDTTYWLARAELHLADAIDEVMLLAPWLSGPAPSSRLEAVPELAGTLAHLWARLDVLCTPHLVESGHVEILALLAELRVVLEAAPMSAELRQECEGEVDWLSRMFESGAEACIDLCTGLARIGERALAIADTMSFRLLFDERRDLFATGYDVGNSRLDAAHHDLLASESRLCSFVCIAKGDVAQSHWQRLGRPRARISGGPALLSSNGSMVEYLLPLLCLENGDGTLLDQAYRAALARQRQYAAEQGVPWGISDSAHNVMDVSMAYGYRAFGVPGLGLEADNGDELVIAPHATLLGGLVRPDWICKNLRALQKEGLDGPYGLYEAIDYTPEHVPPGRRGVVVKAFMGHHQGMSLVALDSLLLGAPMQQRFHRDPRVKATELLLQERIPVGAAPPRSPAATPPRAPAEPRDEAVDHVGLRSPGPLRVQLLCHGELSSLVSATGAGVTTWKGIDVNRFREDPVLEAGGIYLYIKNRTHNQLWSAAHQPTLAEPSFYNVAFSIDRVEFHRKDGDVQTLTEVALSPEHPLELRRVTLTNQGENPLELELTSYTEVVLAPRAADVSHRAFSNMFVETEALPERYALLARRRPRTSAESASWLVQMLVAESGTFGPLDYDCSRLRFLGRGKSTAEPEALAGDSPLAKQAGLMLDTALALRRNIRLAPGASAQLTLATGLASTREEALALIDAYSAKHAIPRSIELGWAGVRVQLGHLGITPTELHRFHRLLSAVVFPHATLRHGARPSMAAERGPSALWAQGISGDLPVLLCRIDDADYTELCRDLLLAHELWRLNGFQSDLVFLDESRAGDRASVAGSLRDLNRGDALMDQRGGVFLRRAEQLDQEQRELLFGVARVVLRAKEGSLARQLRRVLDPRPVPPLVASGSLERAPVPEATFQRPKLTYDNGVGGFGADGREYIMVLEPGVRAPAPWCNVIANPDFGTLVSEVGSSFTWSRSSQRHRLTPWNNDAVSDPSGELLYVRDDDDGTFWSATPEPLGRGARYVVRHGQGYSQFEHERAGLSFELTLFVSPDESLKFSRLRLENRGQNARRLSVFACVEWVLGNNRESSRVAISTSHDATNDILFAANPMGLFPARRPFLAATRPSSSVTGDRAEFFGISGSRSAPEALTRVRLSGNVGAGLDAAGALHVELVIRPGETLDLGILLGEAGSNEEAQSLCAKYRAEGAVNDALARARKTWVDLLGAVRIKTPDRALDLMQNNWLLYQSLSSRVWGRTGFYQSSGAYGYRDQLQDVLASIHARPSIAREHLLRAASRQFLEGDVQHWWHDETGNGLRTRCSDDMLWLPFVTAEYVRMTGDRAVLDERVAFLRERPLREDEEEIYTAPPASEERASLYEHCTRALDVGLTRGEHGLPLMRAGDWNDGMNRVGIEGRGESVWLAWFLVKTLTEFAQVARLMGDAAREASSIAEAKRIAKAVDQHAWDGQWYRRVSFDDGKWLGSRENDECSIDAIAQSWAVIAGQGDPERASLAVAASEARLIVPALRMMKLLDPAFEKTRPDPGYIQSYPAGIRENGGQYTHGVLWTVLALTLLGAGDRAGELLALLNPIRHADTPDGIQRYRVEPYVIAADVYGGSGYEGRGGWTWYTGSAGWMYRIGLEHVIGLRRRGRTLAITPCVPSSWPSFEVEYRYGTAMYHIVVDNPDRVSHGVARLELDGQRISESYIRLESDDRVHEVRVVLGRTQSSRAARAGTQI